MKFELEPDNRNASDEDLLRDLQNVATQLGKSKFTRKEFDAISRFSSTTLIRRFDSWAKALERAGLEQTIERFIPDEKLFENLEEVWLKLGRQPKYGEIVKPLSKYHVATYERRFGGWRSALESFVAAVNKSESELKTGSSPAATGLTKRRTKREPGWRLRFLVMRRDNFKCVDCGRSPSTHVNVILEVDHIQAWSKDGETVMENLRTLCQQCNGGKSNLDFREPSTE